MLKRETLARKAKHIINFIENKAVLVVDGIAYNGILESNGYATKYRDNGWLDGTTKTWIGNNNDLKFLPESGMKVTIDKVKAKILGFQLDPVQNIIRIDLTDVPSEVTM